jgi:hypothetical protein
LGDDESEETEESKIFDANSAIYTERDRAYFFFYVLAFLGKWKEKGRKSQSKKEARSRNSSGKFEYPNDLRLNEF